MLVLSSAWSIEVDKCLGVDGSIKSAILSLSNQSCFISKKSSINFNRRSTSAARDTRQKGVCGALPVGIRLAVRCHFGACRGLEELVDEF